MKTRQEYFFIFSGDGGTLAHSELLALLETYGITFSPIISSDRFVLLKSENMAQVKTIVERGAYLTAACLHLGSSALGRLLDLADSVAHSEKMSGIETFRVDCVGLTNAAASVTIEKRVAEVIKKVNPRFKVSMEKPEAILVAVKTGKAISIGYSMASKQQPRWERRRPKMRPFFYPAALLPKFARALVNLSRVRSGEFLLDPFCGSGSILIEAALMGIAAIGIDISRELCIGAVENLKLLAPPLYSLIEGDARKIPLRNIGGISTDVPYGRVAPVSGTDKRQLIEEFFSSAYEALKEGKFAVVVYPKSLSFSSDGFTLVNRHEIRVHRSLTRVVSEYRCSA